MINERGPTLLQCSCVVMKPMKRPNKFTGGSWCSWLTHSLTHSLVFNTLLYSVTNQNLDGMLWMELTQIQQDVFVIMILIQNISLIYSNRLQ